MGPSSLTSVSTRVFNWNRNHVGITNLRTPQKKRKKRFLFTTKIKIRTRKTYLTETSTSVTSLFPFLLHFLYPESEFVVNSLASDLSLSLCLAVDRDGELTDDCIVEIRQERKVFQVSEHIQAFSHHGLLLLSCLALRRWPVRPREWSNLILILDLLLTMRNVINIL